MAEAFGVAGHELATAQVCGPCRGVAGRATGGGGLDTLKAQRPKIKLVDEGFNDTDRIVFGH